MTLHSDHQGGSIDGVVSMCENVMAPLAKGAHLHTHDFDEAFCVIEGEIIGEEA